MQIKEVGAFCVLFCLEVTRFFFFILKKTGIELTESLAMSPAASVSGLYFASPSASYFSLGKIGEDQIKDYSARKQSSVDDVERWLGSSLSYK